MLYTFSLQKLLYTSPSISYSFTNPSFQKFPTKTSRKKPQSLVSNTAQKLISRYIRDTSHSYILKINSPISQRYHHSSSSQQFHSPTDATTVPSVFKERKRGEYSLERIEISSNHFATPTSNTFAVIPISHGWNSPRRSINQPDKRDGFEAQTEEKVEGEKIRTCAHVCLPPPSPLLPQCVDTVAPLDKKPLASRTMYENRINDCATVQIEIAIRIMQITGPAVTFYYLTIA